MSKTRVKAAQVLLAKTWPKEAKGFTSKLKRTPHDITTWLVLGDWCEEHEMAERGQEIRRCFGPKLRKKPKPRPSPFRRVDPDNADYADGQRAHEFIGEETERVFHDEFIHTHWRALALRADIVRAVRKKLARYMRKTMAEVPPEEVKKVFFIAYSGWVDDFNQEVNWQYAREADQRQYRKTTRRLRDRR